MNLQNLNVQELSLEEQINIEGGLGPVGVAVTLLGFSSGVVIGAAVAYGVYYIATKVF